MMRKILSCVFVLVAGLSSNAFAGTGSAYDGLEFILFFAGFLILLAGLLKGIDYLNRNGKTLVHRVIAFITKKESKVAPPKSSDSDLLPFSI